MDVRQLVFVAFRGHVVALDRDDGHVVWKYETGRHGYAALLLDGDRLIVSVDGYTRAVDAATGRELWRNDLPGMGVGLPSLASARGGATTTGAAEHIRRDEESSSSVSE